jgi:tellurite methyltransferase
METSSNFFRKQLADGVLNGGCALDLGCGTGRESIFLARQGYQVEAIDRNAAHVEQLNAETREDNLSVKAIQARIEDYQIVPNKYSLITARHSLSFIPDATRVLRIIKTMIDGLKPDGMVCFTLFGTRDGWSSRTDMTFFEYGPMIAFLDSLPLSLYYRSSGEYFANTIDGMNKFWHVHTFCYFKQLVSDPHLLELLR